MRAVRNFAAGREGDLLPSKRHDEIGLLAQTIEDMRQQIRAQFASLEQKQQELDHQACHDSLTGLPNRRLFLERLERAMARAHRNGRITSYNVCYTKLLRIRLKSRENWRRKRYLNS